MIRPDLLMPLQGIGNPAGDIAHSGVLGMVVKDFGGGSAPTPENSGSMLPIILALVAVSIALRNSRRRYR